MATVVFISGQLGTAQLGAAQLGQFNTAGTAVSANFLGQGVFNITQTVIVSASFVGQGELTQILFVTGSFTGQGKFQQFFVCPRDATVVLYLVPRALCPSVLMPIAYVTEVIVAETGPTSCGPNVSTIPVTGSLTTLVEGNDGTSLNNV